VKLKFSWSEFRGQQLPGCEDLDASNSANELCAFLTDDGGLGLEFHIPSLQEARRRCETVIQGLESTAEFSSECFDISINSSHANVSGSPVMTWQFARALSDWIAFLEKGPGGSFVGDYSGPRS
jgi:hypothetical protein